MTTCQESGLESPLPSYLCNADASSNCLSNSEHFGGCEVNSFSDRWFLGDEGCHLRYGRDPHTIIGFLHVGQ